MDIRPLATIAEIQAAVDLEAAVWTSSDRDLVPPTEIVAARDNGGLVLGAWEGDRLVGFTFSMFGRRAGRTYQYSRMLAVHPDWRGKGLGAALKEAQKSAALALGDTWMEWTFDPLEARNAALNLRRLGARVGGYYRDYYGARTSRFDLGVPTDRCRVEWDLTEDLGVTGPVRRALHVGAAAAFEVTTGAAGHPVPGPVNTGALADRVCLVPVPAAFQPIRESAPELALAWRLAVRAALEAGLAGGHRIVDFVPDRSESPALGAHVLSRDPAHTGAAAAGPGAP
jgi:predicted GNAT superfamily acetyltransferase